MAELARLTALELLEGYRSRAFSPVEVVDELAERIEHLEPTLNAFFATTLDGAGEQARRAEETWSRGEPRPLEGVPFGVKDLFDTDGVTTTYGSPMFGENVPDGDARAVARAREAGGILIGKTATDEFAYGIAGVNPHYGPARNPWSTEHVSGGSSSGSAVAVAALELPLALGSDTGGSIRVPSAFCGIVGLKGTWGAISTDRMWAMGRTLDHAGPMARTPADVALFHSALAEGSRGRAIAGDLAGPLRPSPAGIRVGVCPDLDFLELTTDVRAAYGGVLQVLGDCGLPVREVSFPQAPQLRTTFTPIRDAETLYTHRMAGLFPGCRVEYSEQTYSRLEAAVSVGLDEYLAASAERARLGEAFERLFDDIDVLVVPLMREAPPLIDVPEPDWTAWEACGAYTVPEDLLGVPACAIRAGFDGLGLPIGVQLVGRQGSDATVLAVAHTYYEATPELQRRWPELA
jgi:aspartyl-tRNA(Asn)/glutamyl-tRNA(Gln) amidotransferase subunit A